VCTGGVKPPSISISGGYIVVAIFTFICQ
jgi:hypothetical protein